MSIPTKIIWVISIALTAAAWWFDHLTFWMWALIVLCTVILVLVFKPKDAFDEMLASMAKSSRPTESERGVRMSVPDATRVRNALMKHHESLRSDKVYQNTALDKDSTAAIQSLNTSLERANPPKARHD